MDLVKHTWDANEDQRLLAFYSEFFDRLGPNLEQKLFGAIGIYCTYKFHNIHHLTRAFTGYITIDPENMEALLSTHFQGTSPRRKYLQGIKCHRSDSEPALRVDYGYGSRRGALLPLLGEGIFSQDGPPWKHSREILRKQFVKLHSQNLEGIGEYVEKLLECLIHTEGVVDLQPFFFRFTLDTTTALIFGQSVENLENPDNVFAEKFNLAQYIGAIRVRFSDFYWAYAPRRYLDACDLVKSLPTDLFRRLLQNKQSKLQRPSSVAFALFLISLMTSRIRFLFATSL